MKYFYHCTAATFLAFCLTACAGIHQPQAVPSAYLQQQSSWAVVGQTAQQQVVLGLFEAAPLQDYFAQLKQANPNLQSLAATAKAVGWTRDVAESTQLPTVTATGTGQRENNPTERTVSQTASVAAQASWDVDLWGKVADEAESANLQLDQRLLLNQQAQRALVAQAMGLWIQRWEAEAQLHLLEQQIDLSHALLDSQQQAYQQGLAPYTDLEQQRIQLQGLLNQLSQQQQLLDQNSSALNIARGALPSADLPAVTVALAAYEPVIPSEISALALEQRPDLQAAYVEIQFLDKDAQAAHKALLPQLSLTGSWTKSGQTLASAMSGNFIWQLVGSVSQTLFDGGQLKAVAKQKSAEAEASYWRYEEAVLKALQEVEDSLSVQRSISDQLAQTQQILNSSQAQLKSVQAAYVDGLASLVELNQAQQDQLSQQVQLLKLRAEQHQNALTLAVALGQQLDFVGIKDEE